MSTSTLEKPPESATPSPSGQRTPAPPSRSLPRWAGILGVFTVWFMVWLFTRGTDTLVLPGRDHTPLHESLTQFRDSIIANRDTNPVMQVTTGIAEVFRSTMDWLQRMVSTPNFPRPVPEIGWLGVTGFVTWAGLVLANWRIALLIAATFTSFGLFGYWTDAIDLLLVTLMAVSMGVLIGLPLAILIGTNRRADTAISWVLDLMQTMPTFVYLIPVVLFFGIGASGAVVCTLVYALPPMIRIAGHGIRTVSTETIEATESTGQSSWQRLTKVQLPLARKTIIVGLNQSIMAALSIATIASFIDGPGLGKPVLNGLIKGDVGAAVVPGLLIVAMAVMLDRTTTAASERSEITARGGGGDPRTRQILIASGGVGALVLVWVSRYFPWAAEFPTNALGGWLADLADASVTWVTETFGIAATALKDGVSTVLLNPLQAFLAESPWWLAAAGITALAFVLGRARAVVPTVVCLAGIWYFDLWHDAMITLNMTLVATVVVMVLALVFGVWMARSRWMDLALRPLLDAGQTIPPFVYLIPVLALFGPTRFTAIVASVVYAAPAAIKLVADGVKGVSPTTLEAARSTGSTTWQEITKVQLPMARGSLVLAANQGLLYVLAMVVIGGLVGAGALGYDVVLGFSRSEEWGKGMAAGITIVLLGVMIDRIARAAAEHDPVVKDPAKRTWWRPMGGA
ncbi:MAG: ABC transporter permease subunit [Nocardioidaceae bacterium]|nr:ABC transporter permease subunit [Nocardioidaceae bacterium]